ncbi:ATP-dependent DNA helicase, partial [Aliarcobacter butzleri]
KKKYPHLEESELKEIIAQNDKIAKKSNIDREELLKENLIRMEKAGINQDFVKNLENKIDSSNLISKEEKENILQSHISQSILTLQENESVFTKESILKESLKYGIESGFTSEDYSKVIDNNENIVKFENNNELDSTRYSSLEILKAENYSYENINVKNYAISDKFNFDKNNVQEFINNSKFANMTDGQKEMFENILTTENQFTIVQGRAGTGKTFSMEALNDFLEDKDIEVIGMSFTGKASEGLEKDSGIKSTTIHKFLIEEKKETNENKKERLIVVDEAGMCGSLQIEELMIIAEKNNDKIVFVGDSKQFNAVNQGKQFTELQNKSDNVVYLDQVMRQETDHTKEIVKSIADKDIESTFKILEQKNLLIESSKEEQVKKIAEKFSSAENKQDILIIASKNEDRKALNSEIRRILEFDESTKNTLTVKESVDFKGIVKKFNNHYENGMIVTVNKKGIEGFKQGDICEVVGKKDKNILILKNQFGKEKELNLKENHENISVFKETKKEFAKDEWIVFNKNIENKKTGFRVKNGERAIIESVDEKGNIKLNNGKSFNSNEVPYFDYGYAITDIKSQGMTAKETIVMADSNMANLNSFYVQATRTKREIEIYTDNIENLTQRTKNEQNKTTTINQKLTLDSKEKYERYVGNIPLKENQDMQKYQDYKITMKKEIENAKSIEKKVNSSKRGQNRLSIANNSELARRIFAKDRNDMRVLSDSKMDCINQRSKMLLSNDVHNELEQGNRRKSDDKMRTTNESNSRTERELKEKKKERGGKER